MDLMDEKGRILGVINVIDALAILLVVAVVVGGASVVLQPKQPPTSPEQTTVSATLDMGRQPEYIARQISAGDTYAPAANSNLTITEVYIAPHGDTTHVLLGVTLTGVVHDGSISYNGAPPRLGRSVALRTDEYQVSGVIRAIGESPASGSTQVLITTRADGSTTAAIQAGDTYEIAGRDVATIESIEAFGTAETDERLVYLGLTLNTVERSDGPQFGDTTVRPNATIPFRTANYALSGSVRRVGTTELRGDPTTRTATLKMTGVRPMLAESLRAGMVETVKGTQVARIRAIDVAPAKVVVSSRNGSLQLQEHPVLRDVLLTVELSVRDTPAGITFKGRSIRPGGTIVLDLGWITIEATVVGL